MIPIIIPLKKDPTEKYLELKYSLRSISKYYKDHTITIIIVGPEVPAWLHTENVTFIHASDNNSEADTNIKDKISKGVDWLRHKMNYMGPFTKFSQDFFLLKFYNPYTEKPKFFSTMYSTLQRLPDGAWADRFMDTLKMLESKSIRNPYNFDTHTPQPYHTEYWNEFCKNVSFDSSSYVINSAYLNYALYHHDDEIWMITKTGNIRMCEINWPGFTKSELKQASRECQFMHTSTGAWQPLNGSRRSDLELFLKEKFPKSIFEK